MLPLSRLIIRMALPHAAPVLYKATVSAGLAAAIHHQTLYSLSLTLFRTLRHGLKFLNVSIIHTLLPKDIKIDLISLRRVLISAVIAKLFRYLLLGTFWIPFRGTIIEILLNEAVGNYSTVKTVIRALNHVTLPWLQEMNSILQWFVAHVQPLGEWHIGIGWIPVIITVSSFATYFYFFPEAGFWTDMATVAGAFGTIFNKINNFLNVCTFGISGRNFTGSYNLVKNLGRLSWSGITWCWTWIVGSNPPGTPQVGEPLLFNAELDGFSSGTVTPVGNGPLPQLNPNAEVTPTILQNALEYGKAGKNNILDALDRLKKGNFSGFMDTTTSTKVAKSFSVRTVAPPHPP